MEKINGLFGDDGKAVEKASDDEVPARTVKSRDQPSKKPSLKDKTDDSKKEVLAADKKTRRPKRRKADVFCERKWSP